MKKFIKISILVLIMVSALSQFVIAFDFSKTEEYQKIINNKAHIVEVKKYSSPEGGFIKEGVSLDTVLKKVESLNRIKKTDMAICDADWHYVFKFDDGTSVKIYFEGPFLHYKGQNYEILK